MNLTIATPYGTTYKGSVVKSITIPTLGGVITIMEDHIPILYIVAPGEVIVTDENGEIFEIAISKGIVEVIKGSRINVLADTAERAEQIDIERAEEARKKAEEFLAKKDYAADVDFAKIQAQLEKEMVRIRVARKYKNVGKR